MSRQKPILQSKTAQSTDCLSYDAGFEDRVSDTHDKRPKRYPPSTIRNWYVRQAGTWWCATNLIAAFACTIVARETTAPAKAIGWLLFTTLNGFLYAKISAGNVRWLCSNMRDGLYAQVAMTITFGCTWGAMLLGSLPYVSAANAIVLSGISIAGLS